MPEGESSDVARLAFGQASSNVEHYFLAADSIEHSCYILQPEVRRHRRDLDHSDSLLLHRPRTVRPKPLLLSFALLSQQIRPNKHDSRQGTGSGILA